MRSKPIVLITLALSALGALLQIWCRSTAFELSTDLPLSGAPALTVLIIFAIAVPILALAVSLPLQGIKPQGENSLYHLMGTPGRIVGILSGAAFVLGGLLRLAKSVPPLLHRPTTLEISVCLVDVLLMAGGAAMVILSLSAQESRFHVRHSLWPLLPGFAGCFWLVIYYHSNSRDAVVLRYCWILLCLMATILAFYYQAGFAFDRVRPLRAQAFSMAGAIYAFTAIPTADELSDLILLLGVGGWMLLHCRLVPRRSEIHGHREKRV